VPTATVDCGDAGGVDKHATASANEMMHMVFMADKNHPDARRASDTEQGSRFTTVLLKAS
jgi:hypothetical protein